MFRHRVILSSLVQEKDSLSLYTVCLSVTALMKEI